MTIKMEPRDFTSAPNVKPATRRRYLGNNQVITLSEVTSNIDIIGNRNTLTVSVNGAIIKVIGDACKVKVHSGCGQVRLVGNNCTVMVGDGVDAAKSVRCVGNNTRVLSIPRETHSEKQTSQATISEIGFYASQDKNSCQSAMYKTNSEEVRKESEHLNGFIERYDKTSPATFVHKQGYLYIDNCVRIRTKPTVSRQF